MVRTPRQTRSPPSFASGQRAWVATSRTAESPFCACALCVRLPHPGTRLALPSSA
jgi:hypothetical protein